MGLHAGQTNSTSFKKGHIMSEEIKKKISLKLKGTRKHEKNPIWKGDGVGIPALHEWVRRNKEKPEFCVMCNKNKPYDLANISGEYKRDLDDFKWICRSCHMKEDNRIKQLNQYKEEKNGIF